jgi:hypothetical protein
MKNTITILLTLLIIWSCQDIDPLRPPEELTMNYGELVSDTLFATADSIVINERVNTYNAPKLCIGNYKNFETTILLRFVQLPDSGSIIDSVAIEFSTLHVLGEAMSDMPVSIYKVEEEWTETANTKDEWHTFAPTTEIDAIQIPSEDSTRIKFTISDTSLIREWISDGFFNKGLYLKCTNPGINYIREIASTEYGVDSLAPQITFRYWDEEDSVFVTDTTYIGLDATIFNNNGNEIFNIAQSQNDLLVASGIGVRTYLEFSDLSLLPPNILVQKAELHVPVWDEDIQMQGQKNSFDNTNDKQNFYINSITDLSNSELDSVYLNFITMTQSDSLVKISTTNNRAVMGKYLIQNIVNGNQESNWFSLQYQNEGQDLSIKRFRRTADNPARLILRYFKVEQSGF